MLQLTSSGPSAVVPYSERVLRDSPLAYWLLSEPSGSTASDIGENTGNICPNPSFEFAGTGGADVFAFWNDIAGDGTIDDETSIVYSGGHAAKLTAGPTANTRVEASLITVPGTTYSFEFYTRGDGTNAGRYLIYDVSNSAIITGHTSTGITGTSYTKYTNSFVAPAGCTSVSFRLECPSANGGVAYFDDVDIVAPFSDGPFDGTYTSVTLSEPGIGDGNTSVKFDGSSSKLNIHRYPLVNGFNPSEFGITLWFKIDSGMWTDGSSRTLFRATADANNYILIYKPDTPDNRIYFQYVAGGTSKAITYNASETGWVKLEMSVSATADELRAWINDVLVDVETGLGVWTSTVGIVLALVGANSAAPTAVWDGWIAHVSIGDPIGYPGSDRVRIPFDAADVDSNGHIYAGRIDTIYKSTDGGNTWAAKYTIPGSVGIIARVFVDSNDYVFASGRSGSSVYGLYRSVDGGDNWTYVLSTDEGGIWGIDEDDSGNLCCGLHGFAGTTACEIWKSTDGGDNWTQKHDVTYSGGLRSHIHDIRWDSRTGWWYATLGDQINERLLRSKDDGDSWSVVSTGGTQLLAIGFLGSYVYIGTDTGSGNKIVSFTDSGSATVTLSDAKTLPAGEDVAIFGAGEDGSNVFFLGYKEGKTKTARLYVYDGSDWSVAHEVLASRVNRGFYTISRHNYGGVFYVSQDYGATYADYGLKFTP